MVIGLVLVLSVDWFMGIGRALTNLVGNCVATVAVGVWEKDIDILRAKRVLDGDIDPSWMKEPVVVIDEPQPVLHENQQVV